MNITFFDNWKQLIYSGIGFISLFTNNIIKLSIFNPFINFRNSFKIGIIVLTNLKYNIQLHCNMYSLIYCGIAHDKVNI